MNAKYDCYGNLKTEIRDEIKPGDTVAYIDAISDKGKTPKTINVTLIGVWDGEKVVFNDLERTTVRTTNWLKKV